MENQTKAVIGFFLTFLFFALISGYKTIEEFWKVFLPNIASSVAIGVFIILLNGDYEGKTKKRRKNTISKRNAKGA